MKYRDPETGEFKELYTKAADTLPVGTVVDYDGDEVPAGWEAAGSDDYSTEETFTGKYWIDGKKIYRKVLFIEKLSDTSGSVLYNHNIQNIDLVWFDLSKCFVHWNNSHLTNTLPFIHPSNITLTGDMSKNIVIGDLTETQFSITVGENRSIVSAYVTIEYTKTTE